MGTQGNDLLDSGLNKRYVNLAHVMRLRIRTGEYQPGDRLPSIEQLAKQFDVAVVTARQALILLEQEGLIKRKQGVGTFVQEGALMPQGLHLPLDEDWSGIRRLWQKSQTRLLAEADHARCAISQTELGVPAQDYYFMRRLHESEGMPYTVADIYLDSSIYSLAPERFRKEIVLHLLREFVPNRKLEAHETIQIATADVEIARLLQIQVGVPVVIMKRIVRDEMNRIIYVGTPIYRGDIVRLDRTFKI